MQKKESLEFCFKGSRNYVQGPDIFDLVIEKLKLYFDLDLITNIKYSAHEMLLTNADMIILDSFDKNNYKKMNSIITFEIGSQKYYVVVIANENKIECSNNYSEEVIRTNSIISDSKINFNNILEDSITELIVSMNKYYLQETVTKNGKWIVTKFEYSNLKDLKKIKNKNLELELKSNFNNKLTKSVITIDNESIGYIYFSLV